MEQKIKDYLKYYLGGKVLYTDAKHKEGIAGLLRNIEFSEILDTATIAPVSDPEDWFITNDLSRVMPILRKLSSMDEEEIKEFIRWDKLNEMYVEVSFVMGERGIVINYSIDAGGEGVYPQTHVISFSCFSPSEFHYLLSKGFDLFGLIESGLAIDKETVK